VGRASTDGLPLTVPSRVPPMRVQAQLTPCEYSEYPNVGHSLPREYLVRPNESAPDRSLCLSGPSGHSNCALRRRREDSRLRCAAVQRARRRPLTAPARPPTPLRVRRQRMRVLRVLRRPTSPRGISIGISCNVGTRPGLGMRCLSGGDPPCRVRLRFSAERALGTLLRH
jgi:hypothetical protein